MLPGNPGITNGTLHLAICRLDMDKEPISLFDITGPGLILLFPSEVHYSNQVGGIACLQPKAQGIFVPLHDELKSQEATLTDYFWSGIGREVTYASSADLIDWEGWGIDEKDADFIDNLLQESSYTRMLTVNRDRLNDSCEAWVHVHVDDRAPLLVRRGRMEEWPDSMAHLQVEYSGGGPYYPILNLPSREAILTWTNSD